MKKTVLCIVGVISAVLTVAAAVGFIVYAKEVAFWDNCCKNPNE